MKMITAQIFPTSGDLKVFGEDPYENANVLSQICFIKESQKYPDHYSVLDVLEVSKSIFPNWDADLSRLLIEDFNLPIETKNKKAVSRNAFCSWNCDWPCKSGAVNYF